MRVAFYAPLKPVDHPTPSGDRRMARAFRALLQGLGHEVIEACRLRSYDGRGDAARQLRLARMGRRLSDRLAARLADAGRHGAPVDLWFTYHNYYKAPDHLGPPVARALGVPYVLAEASHAPRRAQGPWALGHAAATRATGAADLVLAMTRKDRLGLAGLVPADRLLLFPPFLDSRPYEAARGRRAEFRARLAAELDLPSDVPWLLAVAMMRDDVKRRSYEVLAGALRSLLHRAWCLLVVGDGPARAAIEGAFAPLGGERLRFLGSVDGDRLPGIYAAADMYVWPGLREAYGMALLEAQASGLPAVAFDELGIGDIVRHGETGLLVRERSEGGYAAAVEDLLLDDGRRGRMGDAAAERARTHHGLEVAGRRLDDALARVVRRHAAGAVAG